MLRSLLISEVDFIAVTHDFAARCPVRVRIWERQKPVLPPIGIILSRHKDELLVEYATYQMNSQLFVQKYQLYLPDREELQREIEQTLREAGEE